MRNPANCQIESDSERSGKQQDSRRRPEKIIPPAGNRPQASLLSLHDVEAPEVDGDDGEPHYKDGDDPPEIAFKRIMRMNVHAASDSKRLFNRRDM